MKIDLSVRQVAELAKLSLFPQEEIRMEAEMAEILGFARELSGLNLAEVPPTAHVLPRANVLREDRVQPSFSREAMLVNAPACQDGCISVPQTFEEGEAGA